MQEFFKKFEEKLQVAEEKLDILSEWHIVKGHKGAVEIAEDCRVAISHLWIEFYRLSEAYTEQEASHEEFLEKNIQYVLDSIAYNDATEKYIRKNQPNATLFTLLNEISRKRVNHNQETPDNSFVYSYLFQLVKKDQEERTNHDRRTQPTD